MSISFKYCLVVLIQFFSRSSWPFLCSIHLPTRHISTVYLPSSICKMCPNHLVFFRLIVDNSFQFLQCCRLRDFFVLDLIIPRDTRFTTACNMLLSVLQNRLSWCPTVLHCRALLTKPVIHSLILRAKLMCLFFHTGFSLPNTLLALPVII